MIATATAEAVSLIKHEAFIRIVGLALRQNAAGHVSEGSIPEVAASIGYVRSTPGTGQRDHAWSGLKRPEGHIDLLIR